MKVVSATVHSFKHRKGQLSLLILGAFLTLFTMTSIIILKFLITQVNGSVFSNDNTLFTSSELNEIQAFYSNCFVALFILITLLLLAGFIGRSLYLRKKLPNLKQIPYITGLEFFISIITAAIVFIALFALFEPAYEHLLQNFYQESLGQFKDLPSFVLSNGSSGIAYSLHTPLSFNLSSITLLELFCQALIRTVGILSFLLIIFVLLFSFIFRLSKKKNFV